MRIFTFSLLILLAVFTTNGQVGKKSLQAISDHIETMEAHLGPPAHNALKHALKHPAISPLHAPDLKAASFSLKMDSIIESSPTAEKTNWVPDYKTTYAYDDDWRISIINEYERDVNNTEWLGWEEISFIYNAQGQLTELLAFDVEYEEWTRRLFYYDDDGLLVYEEHFGTEEPIIKQEWIFHSRRTYRYNNNSQLVEIETEMYDDLDEEWVSMFMRYTYNADNRMETARMYMPGDEGGEEMLFLESEFFYDANGRLSIEEESILSFTTFELSKMFRTEFFYDADGDQHLTIEYFRFEETWRENSKEEVLFDSDIQFSDVVYPYGVYLMFFATPSESYLDFKKLPIGSLDYDMVDGDYVLSYRVDHYYSPTIPEAETHTLTYLAGDNGSILGNAVQTVPDGGDGSQVEARPNEGYHFTQWSDGHETALRTDRNVTEDITVTALFDINVYAISVSANNDSYGSVSGGGDYDHFETVTLTATPNEGSLFSHWEEGGTQVMDGDNPAGETYVFMATSARDLVAHFEQEPTYTLTFDIRDASTGTAIADAVITLNGVEHDAGVYVFANLSADEYTYQIGHGNYHDVSGSVEVINDHVTKLIEMDQDDTAAPTVEAPAIRVFPNPASDRIHIRSEALIMEVRVVDMLGKTLISESVGDKTHTLNVSGLKNGLYFVQIMSHNGLETLRIQVNN